MKKKTLLKLNKKIVAFALAFAMMVTTGIFLMPNTLNAEASEASGANDATSEAVTPNEVADGMLDVKMQIQTVNNKLNMRLISSVNGLGYSAVGFEVYFDKDNSGTFEDATEKVTFTTTTVLERINASKTGVTYKYSPKVINTAAKYFITGTLIDIDQEKLANDFYVRAFCVSLDGTKTTYGAGRYFNITDATEESIINIPVADAEEVLTKGSTVKVTVAGIASTATVEANRDGYAHLNVEVPAAATMPETKSADKTLLASANKIAVMNEAGTAELDIKAIYRNLESTYANNGADYSWYDVYKGMEPGETEFVIATDADLYGFQAKSTVHEFNTFTIYQVADIDVNNTEAIDWETGALETGYETYTINNWTPISNFKGTFDAQMHSISGLYAKRAERYTGLFLQIAAEGTVKNLKVLDSYFEHTGALTEAADIGSIAGRLFGSLNTVYSKATVVSNGRRNGGLVGDAVGNGENSIQNCWFAGKVSLLAQTGKFGGGLIGRLREGVLTIEDCLNAGQVTCEDPNTSGGIPAIGGVCGILNNSVGTHLKVINAMNTGSIKSSNRTATDGTIVGYLVGAGAQLTMTNVYSTTESGNRAIGANEGNAGTINGAAVHKAKSYFSDTAGYTYTLLDFENTWETVSSATPELKAFSTSAGLDLTGVKRIDTTWYDTTANKTFEIDTLAKFYGFQELSKSYNFATQTIKLTTDIAINENCGDASTWGTNTPEFDWLPIGKRSATETIGPNMFAGTFNGEGHTISGLYVKANVRYTGMFGGIAAGATVQNFKLLNSYFEHTGGLTEAADVGSIVGRLNGNLDKIYSAATVVSNGYRNGGLVGDAFDPSGASITKCWFGGTLSLIGTYGKYGGGIVGRHNAGTLTIKNCLNTGTISCVDPDKATGVPSVGGICGQVNVGDLTIETSMNTGSVTCEGRKTSYGAIVGYTPNKVPTFTSVYSTTQSAASAIGTCNTNVDATKVTHLDANDFAGDLAKTNTALDFDTVWEVQEGSTPILKNVR